MGKSNIVCSWKCKEKFIWLFLTDWYEVTMTESIETIAVFILLVEEKKGLKTLWKSHKDDGSKSYDLLVTSLRCFYRSLPALKHSESAQLSTSWYSQNVTKNHQRKRITTIYVLQVLIWSTVTSLHHILRSQISFRRREISFPSWKCGCGCRGSYLPSPTPPSIKNISFFE